MQMPDAEPGPMAETLPLGRRLDLARAAGPGRGGAPADPPDLDLIGGVWRTLSRTPGRPEAQPPRRARRAASSHRISRAPLE